MSKDFDTKAKQIRELAALDPNQLSDHLINKNPTLSNSAPGLAPHLYATASKALNYLNAKLPKPAAEFMGGEEWSPSSTQKADWLEHYNTVNDPISTLDHVKNGSLTQNHMEALQSVHPDLLGEMQQQVMSQMTPKNMRTLPYSTRIAVSKFLGQPQDHSLLPNVILSNQSNFATATSAPASTGVTKGHKSTLGGLSKLNLAKRATTETQADESDGD